MYHAMQCRTVGKVYIPPETGRRPYDLGRVDFNAIVRSWALGLFFNSYVLIDLLVCWSDLIRRRSMLYCAIASWTDPSFLSSLTAAPSCLLRLKVRSGRA